MKLQPGLPKTLVAALTAFEAAHPGAITEAWTEDNDGLDYWVILGAGFGDTEADTHGLHERTVADIRWRLRDCVRKCSCVDCRRLIPVDTAVSPQ